jgi:membrane protease YdiL (CAAX protease family)
MPAVRMPSTVKPARVVLVVTWGAMLVAMVPHLLWREGGRNHPRVAVGGAGRRGGDPAWACAAAAQPSTHLGVLLALLALMVGGQLQQLIRQSAAWGDWAREASWGLVQIADKSLGLIAVVLMAVTLIGSGIGPRELFLVKGDPSALAQPSRLLGLNEPTPWTRVAREFLPVYVVILVVVLALMIRPNLSQAAQALVYLPAVVIAAAINAFHEEFRFRSVALAHLVSVIGPGQALWLTAVAFGIGHWDGNPRGPIGVLLATYLGWLMGKSMLETRGFVWAFVIHFTGDFLIYLFQAMA